ncbi:TlpA disulfide reductase family protein [Sphingobacterium sp. HMA12]|uniref:TlpA family protein disulfide reductase n=1 Tax=Sphingobacterium sp. HMA12 TaxID=2050894 RepID=UPI000CE9DBAA|nr:TlpA disulfide reductase family protein [Sphingobacterium sp. HMA12]
MKIVNLNISFWEQFLRTFLLKRLTNNSLILKLQQLPYLIKPLKNNVDQIFIRFLCLFFILIFPFCEAISVTKSTTHVKPLEVGDLIPEELWDLPLKVVNYPSKREVIKLKNYKNKKLIILDFWATWCGSCIVNMPRTHKLELENAGIVFVPVTYESSEKTVSFIKSNYITDSLDIFSIVGDVKMKEYFPHNSLPHYVWISSDGRVRSITGARQVTSANINRMLDSSNTTNLVMARDVIRTSALLLSNDLDDLGLKQYSVFIKGVRPEYTHRFFERTLNGRVYGRCYTNATLKAIYATIVTEILRQKGVMFNMTTDIVLDVKNPQLLDFEQMGVNIKNPNRQALKYEWEEANLYSYDVIMPLNKSSELYDHILSLINDSTPYEGIIEKLKEGDREKFILIIKDDQK